MIPNLYPSIAKTLDDKFIASYVELLGPANIQSTNLKFNSLGIQSPAVKGYLRRVIGLPFTKYSRTDMDVISLPTEEKIALVKNHIISDLYGGVEDIVAAHNEGNPYFIESTKDSNNMHRLLNIIKFLEGKQLAYIIEPGNQTANDFSKGILQFMYSDNVLGIKAEEYFPSNIPQNNKKNTSQDNKDLIKYIKNLPQDHEIKIFSDSKDLIKMNKLPTISIVCIDANHTIHLENDCQHGYEHATGVRLDTIGDRIQKFPYTTAELLKITNGGNYYVADNRI